MKQINYYFDMDGVLAQYERSAYIGETPLWLNNDIHYFKNCQPDTKMVEIFRAIHENHKEHVHVISNVNHLGHNFLHQTKDKKLWLQDYCGFFNIKNFHPVISSKRNYVESIKKMNLHITDILIDDYNPNLTEWAAAGGTAIKYCNGLNTPETFDGLCLTPDMTKDQIIETLSLLEPSLTFEQEENS